MMMMMMMMTTTMMLMTMLMMVKAFDQQQQQQKPQKKQTNKKQKQNKTKQNKTKQNQNKKQPQPEPRYNILRRVTARWLSAKPGQIEINYSVPVHTEAPIVPSEWPIKTRLPRFKSDLEFITTPRFCFLGCAEARLEEKAIQRFHSERFFFNLGFSFHCRRNDGFFFYGF